MKRIAAMIRTTALIASLLLAMSAARADNHGWDFRTDSFPKVTFVHSSLMDSALVPDDFTVSEDGVEVKVLSVVPEPGYESRRYRITYLASQVPDGETRSVEVAEAASPRPITYHYAYRTPSRGFAYLTRQHPWATLLGVVAMLALICALVMSLRRRRRAARKLQQIQESRLQEMERRLEALNERLMQIQQEQNSLRQKDREDGQRRSSAEERNRLTSLMRQRRTTARLLCGEAPGRQGEMFTLADAVTTIGSDKACDIPVQDPTVSRRHAEIRFDGTGFRVHDLDSANGVILNGHRVSESAPLANGDVMSLGNFIIRFYL